MKILFFGLLAFLLLTPVWGMVEGDTPAMLKRANSGDVEAMRVMGKRLYKGDRAPCRRADGVKWLKMAADRGDMQAMEILGDLYMAPDSGVPQDPKKAEEYYKMAEAKGSTKAKKKLDTIFAKASATAVTTALPVFSAAKVAKSVAAAAKKHNVKSCAMVRFLYNGTAENTPIGERIRDEVLGKLTSKSNLVLFDRMDAKMVAAESCVSCEDEAFTGADTVLVGELFCEGGDSVGYFSYRLFRTSDSRILDAGFYRLFWSEDARTQISYMHERARKSFSIIPDGDMARLAKELSKAKAKCEGGVAMVIEGGMEKNNTLDARLAKAQMMPAIMQANMPLYEREFLKISATEKALDGAEIEFGSDIKALCHIRCARTAGNSNNVTANMTTVPAGGILMRVAMKQVRGNGDGGKQGNDDLDSLMNDD